MLPIPATVSCPSRHALIMRRRSPSRARRYSAVSARSNGSRPSFRMPAQASSPSPCSSHKRPKRRASEKRSSRPSRRRNTTCVCGSSALSAGASSRQAAGHAQMHGDAPALRQQQEQVFAAARQVGDGPPRQPRAKAGRIRMRDHLHPAHADAVDHAAAQLRREHARDGLHLRQFRHGQGSFRKNRSLQPRPVVGQRAPRQAAHARFIGQQAAQQDGGMVERDAARVCHGDIPVVAKGRAPRRGMQARRKAQPGAI